MFMPYLYLSLIPTLIAILLLFFNKSFKKRYDIKRTIPVLVVILIAELISITHEVWFMYNGSQINMYSLKYLLSLFAIYISAPILVLLVNKIYKENTVFRSKWLRVILSMLWLALIWFISIVF